MSEIEADEDFFDDGFNEKDLEMTVAFEEQWVSSQAAPLFPALDDRPTHADTPQAPLPVQAPPLPPARQQYHHHQQRQTQRESQADVRFMRTYRARVSLLTR